MSKIGIASASNAALIDLFSFRRNVHYFKIFYSNKPGAIQVLTAVIFFAKRLAGDEIGIDKGHLIGVFHGEIDELGLA